VGKLIFKPSENPLTSEKSAPTREKRLILRLVMPWEEDFGDNKRKNRNARRQDPVDWEVEEGVVRYGADLGREEETRMRKGRVWGKGNLQCERSASQT